MVSLSPTIAKIKGIRIQLHWSFLFLIILSLVLSLYLFLLLVAVFVFVLIHELSHSLLAKRYKIRVKKIVLLPIGGASIIDFDKVLPQQELRIALAGPLSNIAMGIVFLLMFLVFQHGLIPNAGTGPIMEDVYLLFEINMVLGLLNLLPGFPIDGGRILRGYLQERMDFFKATSITVRVSTVIVVLIIAATVVYLAIGTGSVLYKEFIFLYDLLIAFFLYSGSQAEMRWAYIKKVAPKFSVRAALTTRFVLAKREEKLRSLYVRLMRAKTNIALIRSDQAIRMFYAPGLDVMAAATSAVKGQREKTVSDQGIEIPMIGINDRLIRALEKMRNEESDAIAVMKGKKIVGLITAQQAENAIAINISRTKGKG